MKMKTVFGVLAVSSLLLANAAIVTAQEVEPQAIASQTLGVSVNAVDVWLLRCTTTPSGVTQFARARVFDAGGVDGRRIYLHLTRQLNGRTGKTVAPDGGTSAFTTIPTGGAGSAHFVQVSKDRVGAAGVLEPYRLQAECIAGGVVRPHTLVLVQNQ